MTSEDVGALRQAGDVPDQPARGGHRLDKRRGDRSRIGIMQAHPARCGIQPIDGAQQLGKAVPPTDVPSIGCRILGDKIHLFHALGGEAGDLLEQFSGPARAHPAAKSGNGAESAALVAAFGDLDVRRPGRGEPVPWLPAGDAAGGGSGGRQPARFAGLPS